MATVTLREDVEREALEANRATAQLTDEAVEAALTKAGALVRERRAEILAANTADYDAAVERLDEGMLDRLRLDDSRVDVLAEQVEAVAVIAPLEREIDSRTLPMESRSASGGSRPRPSAPTSRRCRTWRSTSWFNSLTVLHGGPAHGRSGAAHGHRARGRRAAVRSSSSAWFCCPSRWARPLAGSRRDRALVDDAEADPDRDPARKRRDDCRPHASRGGTWRAHARSRRGWRRAVRPTPRQPGPGARDDRGDARLARRLRPAEPRAG